MSRHVGTALLYLVVGAVCVNVEVDMGAPKTYGSSWVDERTGAQAAATTGPGHGIGS